MSSKSNSALVVEIIKKYPGLRFFELKKQTGLVNGVLQHHIRKNEERKNIKLVYDNNTPRYYTVTLITKIHVYYNDSDNLLHLKS